MAHVRVEQTFNYCVGRSGKCHYPDVVSVSRRRPRPFECLKDAQQRKSSTHPCPCVAPARHHGQWRQKEPTAKTSQVKTEWDSGQRPALLNDFANSPAALKAAIACFAVMATVVFVSVLLPPAAPTTAMDNATSLFGQSIITSQSSSPNVR